MILELRSLVSGVAVVPVSLALLFLQWQFVFPVFALAYLGYKYFYYRRRIDPAKTGAADAALTGRLLEKTALLGVGLLVVTRLVVFPLFAPVWSVSSLGVPVFDLSNLGVFLDQVIPLVSAWATVLVPLAVVSYAVGQFRVRLLGGVDSERAAARAALWESGARIPVYLLWASLFVLGPVYELWIGPVGAANLGVPAPVGLSPVLGPVFPVVAAAGHLVPLAVIGAYVAVNREKYGDRTIPEVLGYRGLYPPERSASTANLVVPGVAYLLYAVAAVVFVPVGAVLQVALLLPVLVAVGVAADVRGLTSTVTRSLPNGVPGVGADAVVFGLCVGLVAFVPFALLGAITGVGLGADPAAAVYFPVVAVPLSFGANAGLAVLKAGSVTDFTERVEADPGALEESEVDRLLVYADARSDRLRAAAIDGLATAVWASPYREDETVAMFQAALDEDDERFVRPGLRGIVLLLRAGRGFDSVSRVLDGAVMERVVTATESKTGETGALAAEAFCRIVETSYRAGRADELLAPFDRLPLSAVEAAVTGEAANQQLTDAAVESFAVCWYERERVLAGQVTADDERTLLTDLVWWAGFASELPRGKAAYAVASDDAVTDAAGIDAVREHLRNDVALVRFMAAHVVRSSLSAHPDRVDDGELIALLGDEHDLVRWAGAEALGEYVRAVGGDANVRSALVDHLRATDPATAGSGEATVLATLERLEGDDPADPAVAETVAAYVTAASAAVAEPAARLLAAFVAADPQTGTEASVMDAIEAGLSHESDAVREHCVEAAAAVVERDPSDGRPFVKGLVLNLGTTGVVSEVAASTLIEILEEFPEYGTEFLPEMVGGLRNPTSISRQYAGAMVVGRTVSQVTASILADITEYDTAQGEVLIGPLVDLAGNTQSAARESVFAALANLSRDYPDAAREALPAAQAALDGGNVRVRRTAAEVLSNVAVEFPDAVAPFVASLIIAIDDSDPQMRSIALVTLGTVGADSPAAIEDDVRRIIGRLDDDSALVREHAAKAIITVAQRQPDIVEPAAEASDRLRRIQRDPAVDLDDALVQEAANAIRTGTPPGEDVETAEGDTSDVFTPESAAEAGKSGDTRLFDPTAGEGVEAATDAADDGDLPTEPPASADSEFPTEPPEPDDGDDETATDS